MSFERYPTLKYAGTQGASSLVWPNISKLRDLSKYSQPMCACTKKGSFNTQVTYVSSSVSENSRIFATFEHWRGTFLALFSGPLVPHSSQTCCRRE